MNTFIRRLLVCFWILSFSLFAGSGFGAERVTYYHLDLLGSPVAATDHTGAVVWRESYKPYGQRMLREDDGSNKLWYTGKAHEEGMQLSYYGARWYHPQLGRFLAVDPVDFQEDNVQSFNRYAYANNNPYKYVDPDGRAAQLVIWGLAAALTAYDMSSNKPISGHEQDGIASVITVPGPIGLAGKATQTTIKFSQVPKASELRKWAEIQGYRQTSKKNGVESWVDPKSGDWRLKIKDGSKHEDIHPESRDPRYAARTPDGKQYLDPVSGKTGTRKEVGHNPLQMD